MPLITIAQLNTHIYAGTSNLISQGNSTLLQNAIDAAINEAKGYCSRYRTEQLFDNVDNNPQWIADPTLAMYVKSIAKWHFLTIGNANIDYEDAQIRYESAIKWLSSIQSGKVVPVNWPSASPEGKSTFFHISSNKKRNNHFH